MLFTSLLTLIVAIPINAYRITSHTYIRMTVIIFIYSALLAFNTIYIESIRSGISIYSGLFQITTISQRIEIFIYITGIFILFGIYSHSPSDNKSSLVSFSQSSRNRNHTGKRRDYVHSGSFHTIKRATPIYNEFSLMILFTTIGASFLISSSDLISIYLSIELQSFAVYVLATLYRNSESSTAAGLKYFLLGGLSSALILLGTGIIYSFIGITQIEGIYNLIASSVYINYQNENLSAIYFAFENSSILFGMILISIGFLFKVAAAPFHSWAPDVYNGVPTVIRSWITTMPKISIFILLLELHSGIESIPSFVNDFYSIQDRIVLSNGIDSNEISNSVSQIRNANQSKENGSSLLSYLSSSWPKAENIPRNRHTVFKNLLLISSLFSLLIGTIVGLSQYRIKRLLAFSTISHVGFILLALAIYTEESIDSFLFYIIQYSITNVNVFLILLAFGYLLKNKRNNKEQYNKTRSTSNNVYDIEFIDELKGQFYQNPLLSIRFALSLFSMAGIPPLIGFFAKQMVLYSSIHNGYYFISIVAILVSVISASYYLKIIQTMYFDKVEDSSNENTRNLETNNRNNGNEGVSIEYTISNVHSIVISVITIIITMFIVHPSIITNFSQILRLSIFTYLSYSMLGVVFFYFLRYIFIFFTPQRGTNIEFTMKNRYSFLLMITTSHPMK